MRASETAALSLCACVAHAFRCVWHTGSPSGPGGPLSPKSPGNPWGQRERLAFMSQRAQTFITFHWSCKYRLLHSCGFYFWILFFLHIQQIWSNISFHLESLCCFQRTFKNNIFIRTFLMRKPACCVWKAPRVKQNSSYRTKNQNNEQEEAINLWQWRGS